MALQKISKHVVQDNTLTGDQIANTLNVDVIEPQSGTTLTIGASGDTITVPTGATFSAPNITMKPFFKVYKSANTNLSSGVQTLVVHNEVVYDADAVYDNANGKFVVPSGGAGYYFLNSLTRITGSANTFQSAYVQFALNGSNAEYMQRSYTTTGGNFNNDQLNLSTVMQLSEADEVEVFINLTVSSGTPILVGSAAGTGGTTTRFEAFKLIGI